MHIVLPTKFELKIIKKTLSLRYNITHVIKMSTDKKNQEAFNLTNISPPPAHTIKIAYL
ncbi:MAG: hypothetical protein OES34_02065 [Nitrosopumilus sp.]|nr:hypothetical protein [Nitrosopumilus sp.]